MPRPNRTRQQRQEFLPIIAQAFAQLGYRRTTTAELAARCGVRENILYRLWPDKRAMFVATIEYVYSCSEKIWQDLLQASKDGESPAERLLRLDWRDDAEVDECRGRAKSNNPDDENLSSSHVASPWPSKLA